MSGDPKRLKLGILAKLQAPYILLSSTAGNGQLARYNGQLAMDSGKVLLACTAGMYLLACTAGMHYWHCTAGTVQLAWTADNVQGTMENGKWKMK